MMANELASCMADRMPVHVHSIRTWSMNLIENRREAKLLRHRILSDYQIVNIATR